MADWDATNPDDNDLVSQYPANERAARAAVVTNFGVDHHETNDADVGKHEFIQLVDMASDPTTDTGQLGLWNNDGTLSVRNGTGDVRKIDKFPDGTRMVFVQASAPVGWTNVAGLNDRALIIDNSDGGTTGGSWTISGVTVDSHSLTVGQMPAHDHGGGGNTGSSGSHNHGGSTGSDGGHNHGVFVDQKNTDTDGSDIIDSSNDYMASHTWESGDGGSPGQGYAILDASLGAFVGRTSEESDHSHTISTQSSHTHTYSIPSEGSGSGHNHGLSANGNWRPSHVNVLVCEKD